MGNASGKALPFTPQNRVDSFRHASVWQVYDGVSTSDANSRVLIFRHDKRSNPPPRPIDTACAQNALKRLRMMRHPHVLKFIVRPERRVRATAARAPRAPSHAISPSRSRARRLRPPPPPRRMASTMTRPC